MEIRQSRKVEIGQKLHKSVEKQLSFETDGKPKRPKFYGCLMIQVRTGFQSQESLTGMIRLLRPPIAESVGDPP